MLLFVVLNLPAYYTCLLGDFWRNGSSGMTAEIFLNKEKGLQFNWTERGVRRGENLREQSSSSVYQPLLRGIISSTHTYFKRREKTTTSDAPF